MRPAVHRQQPRRWARQRVRWLLLMLLLHLAQPPCSLLFAWAAPTTSANLRHRLRVHGSRNRQQHLVAQSLGVIRSKPLLLHPLLMDYYKNHPTEDLAPQLARDASALKSSSPESQRRPQPRGWVSFYDEHPSLPNASKHAASLAPPPYLLNVLTKWPTKNADEPDDSQNDQLGYVISTSFPASMKDQKWSESNEAMSTSANLGHNSTVTPPEMGWFEKLRAKLTGYTPAPTMSPADISQNRLHYYADYDVMMGIRIAISLSSIISLFALFITYKSYCNARRQRLRSANCPAAGVDVGLTGSFSRSSHRSRSISAKPSQ